ncbi:hypothetical protein QTP88_022668 [Uroleucon formosanum]
MSEEINIGVATGISLPKLSSLNLKYRTNGFRLGLEPEMIIHSKLVDGRNYLLMKWKGVEKPSYVKASVANKKCPSIVIDFYQKHLAWSNH